MTATPAETLTSYEAYKLFTDNGAIIIANRRGVFVVIGGASVAISDPEEIKTWMQMDLQTRIAVPFKPGHYQHREHVARQEKML